VYSALLVSFPFPLCPYVSGILTAKRQIGIRESARDPNKLATCPILSTAICPRRLERVAPRPKHDAVSPTTKQKQGGNKESVGTFVSNGRKRYILNTLNLPVPNVMSATKYG